jgi:alkanesulfonate monooxygenase SsuD/methylene tetrahydromethanopterin reductase-like flavin-dependent oxidoreductase (luciferase family)
VVANKVNIVCNAAPPLVRQITDAYRAQWAAAGHDREQLPLMGMGRAVVIAQTEREALAIARRAHQRWYHSLMLLWNKHGTKPISGVFLDNFDDSQRAGFGFAGTPEKVSAALRAQIAEAGVNYIVCRFAFGDMTPAESRESLELFARDVMPQLCGAAKT